MLARLKKELATVDAAEIPLADRLVIPKRPDDTIKRADDAAKAATATRMEAEARHREALRQLHGESEWNRRPDKEARPPSLTHAEVDDLGKVFAEALSAEKIAIAATKEAREAFQAAVDAALTAPMQELAERLSAKIDELEEIASLGIMLLNASVAHRVDLPMTTAGICKPIIEFSVHQGRKFLANSQPRRR